MRQVKRCAKRGDKEETTKKSLSQCSFRAQSRRVAGDLSPWRGECRGACMMAVWLLKNYTAPYSDQVLHHPSPSSNKPLFSLPISVFLLCSYSRLEGFFIMIFRFSSAVPLLVWEVFYRLISCPVFLLSLPIIRLGGFSPATWLFEIHQLPYGARIFSVVSRFFSSIFLIRLGGFSPGFPFANSMLNRACIQRKRQL